jgi:hypothetical protein
MCPSRNDALAVFAKCSRNPIPDVDDEAPAAHSPGFREIEHDRAAEPVGGRGAVVGLSGDVS